MRNPWRPQPAPPEFGGDKVVPEQNASLVFPTLTLYAMLIPFSGRYHSCFSLGLTLCFA
jgi:hypothetical protein